MAETFVYLRVARARAWWKLLLEPFLAILWWFVAAIFVGAIGMGLAHSKKLDELDIVSRVALIHVTIAMMIPAALAAAHVMGRRANLIVSIAGKLRWAWLGRCFLCAIASQTLFIVTGVVIELVTTGGLAGLSHAGAGYLEIAAMTVLLVPFQAAGEEVFNRGTLQQVIGGWGAPAWLAMVISTGAFVAMHGTPNIGTIAIAAMGLSYAWLTLETGGLEAAVAGHAINNIVAFLLGVAAHGTKSLDPREHNDHVGGLGVAIQLLTIILYVALVLRSWRRQTRG